MPRRHAGRGIPRRAEAGGTARRSVPQQVAPIKAAFRPPPNAHAIRPVRPGPAACRGFTLVEVVVALGIVAVALLAGLQATSGLLRHADRQVDVVLAQLCADNEQARLRLANQLPGLGTSSHACEQAGAVYTSEITVSTTPNPGFRRIDVRVLHEQRPVLQLSSVLGR
jgi:general secretion pathway protein I